MNGHSLSIEIKVPVFVACHHNPSARVKEKAARQDLDVNHKLKRQIVAI
jgi:hypothetical protein